MFDVLLFLSYYTQLLAIMNPFSVIPTFIALTKGVDEKGVRKIVKKATLAGLFIVVTFTLVGRQILEVFNVSTAGLRVGGGIILLTIALDMLGDEVRTKKMSREDVAVVPIATPLIIGPGTMTTILLLTSSTRSYNEHLMILIAGILACLTSFAILYVSEKLTRVVPLSTLRALGRFMALIIAGVAVEMIVHGIHQYYVDLFT